VPLTLLAVFLGGVVGTGARMAADWLIPGVGIATLVVNMVGSFALGVLVSSLWRRAPHWLRAGLGVGVLGSFTTFSTVALTLIRFAEAGDPLTAVLYLAATLLLGLAAAWLGLRVGTRPAPIDWRDE
jgi:CrcB protein